MIIIKVLNQEFTYKGKIVIRIDDRFVYISASGYIAYVNYHSWDYNVHDTFLINEVESIKGLDNDQ